MAWEVIDDAAELCRDDGSWSAPLLRMQQRRVKHVHDTRLPAMGWSAPNDAPVVLESIWPACMVVGALALPDSDRRWQTLKVRVAHDAPVMDNEGGSPDAVWLYATTADFFGRYLAPPMDLSEWTTLATDATSPTELTARILPHRTGHFVLALLWVRSKVYGNAESAGSTTVGPTTVSGITLTYSTGSAPAGGARIGRALMLAKSVANPDTSNDPQPVGPLYQIGWYDDGDDIAHTIPNVRSADLFDATDASGNPSFSIYPIGQLPVRGVWTQADAPSLAAPAETAYATDEPLDGRIEQMAVAIRRMRDHRLPQWGGQVLAYGGLPWYVRGTNTEVVGLPTRLTDEYLPIAAWPARHPLAPADRNGHVAGAALLVMDRTSNRNGAVGRPLQLEFVLRAYASPGARTTPVAEGDAVSLHDVPTVAWDPHRSGGAPYTAPGHTLRMTTEFGDWSARGLLQYPGPGRQRSGGLHDLRQSIGVEVYLAEDDVTYPCTLVLEARVVPLAPDDQEQILTVAVIAAGCAPLPLDEEIP